MVLLFSSFTFGSSFMNRCVLDGGECCWRWETKVMNYSPLIFCTKAIKQKRRSGFGPLALICGVFFSSKPVIKDLWPSRLCQSGPQYTTVLVINCSIKCGCSLYWYARKCLINPGNLYFWFDKREKLLYLWYLFKYLIY